jgi:cytochrome bd ubiquinol oxidase subunit II
MAVTLIAIVWAGVTTYALLGGADFGAGVLHLLSRGPGAERQRQAITTTIGPVWEANHVWLIFSITGLFSAFPRAFDTLGTLAFEPATLALIAIVVRGAALAFAGHGKADPSARVLFQRLFGLASVAAPFFFGTIAGGLARGRSAGGLGFWIGPFQLVVGALALAICTALAASYMAVESHREGDPKLVASFRRSASLGVTAVTALALLALALMPLEAPRLFHGLVHRALPEVALALLGLLGAHIALMRTRYRLARAALAFAVAAVIWGWGFAQYPRIAGAHMTVANAAASGPELTAVTFALAGGFVLLAPSLWALYVAFRRQPQEVQR